MSDVLHIYVDEAGRGPLAGPVSVGVVLPSPDTDFSLAADSKKMTEKQREVAFALFSKDETLLQSVQFSTAKSIDTKGIIPSLRIAVCKGIYSVLCQYL